MYGKIFRQIFDSSIADNWKTRVVFQDLIILADSDGLVDMTPESISARTRYPLEMVKDALYELLAPDPRSRTPDKEGRRLELVSNHRSWGYKIVNYQNYRAIKAEFDRRSYQRKYMRKTRKRKALRERESNSLTESNQSLTSPSPSPCSSPSLSMSVEREVKKAMGASALANEARDIAEGKAFGLSTDTAKAISLLPVRPSIEEVKLYCAKAGISDADAEWFFYKCEGNGWTNNSKPIKRWGATLMSWKSAGFLPTQKHAASANNTKAVNRTADAKEKQESLKLIRLNERPATHS